MSRNTATVEARTSAGPAPKPEETSPPSPPPRRVSGWVKAFVAFHLIAITIWAIPEPPEGIKNGRIKWTMQTDSVPHFTQSLNDGLRLFTLNKLKPSAVKFYLLPTGFWQYWDMFAPNPANVDYFCDADVIYKDGTVRVYQYPRMYKLGIGQKYFMERFRKYYERANMDSYQAVWPAFAQRVALLSTTDPNNPPVEVRLRRHTKEVMPPDKPQPTDYTSQEYFRYSVDQAKLAKDLRGDE